MKNTDGVFLNFFVQPVKNLLLIFLPPFLILSTLVYYNRNHRLRLLLSWRKMYFKLIFSYFHILYDNIDTIYTSRYICDLHVFALRVRKITRRERRDSRIDDLSSCLRYGKYSMKSLSLSLLRVLTTCCCSYCCSCCLCTWVSYINFIATTNLSVKASPLKTLDVIWMLICIFERLSGIYSHICRF